jgi:hypothetical protein
MRDDSATHIAGIRINVFTAGFVFIGAVVYMLLAPKGREDPATLGGHEPDEERAVEELAGELAAAAKGSGILAAVTVAGDHEQEDAEAVGDDTEADAEFLAEVDAETDADAEFVAEVEAEEATTEAELEDEIVAAEADFGADSDSDSDSEVLEVAADESDTAMVIVTESTSEDETEIVEDDAPVVVYASTPVTEAAAVETVVVYESASDEVTVEAEAEPEVTVEAEAEPEVTVEAVAETETEIVVQPEPETAGFGSTLRRLLWGVGSKGGD